MSLSLLTGPTIELVTLAEAKEHLRVSGSEEDNLITSLILGATAYMDGWRGVLGRAIMPQTWKAEFRNEIEPFLIQMPDAVVTAVTADAVAVTTYTTTPTPLGLYVNDVAGDLVSVTFTCGMTAQMLPAAKTAMLLLIGHWFANREAVGASMAELPMAVSAIMETLRWGRL
jgi:hypothetical protein